MDNKKPARNESFEKYVDTYTFRSRLHRLVWNVCYALLFRPFGLPIFHGWRRMLLRLFGAKIGKGSIVHAGAKIWAPWNLELGVYTAIASGAILYNPARIVIGSKVAVSQYAYLCTASHDITSPQHTLISSPIVIENRAWVAARAFVGPGVKVGEGAVVGATASVYRDVEAWTVVGGNPARFLKKREINPA